ncbi:colicin E3/pyocin S6 family cytotoxin [Kitasatospora phosalacinea]|uniref:colicin E3/pyocin S6 family cytotoxin n=1 Tax=Kitasatospora phosalacinea TaxID=2065 RepID=UPI00365BCD3C
MAPPGLAEKKRPGDGNSGNNQPSTPAPGPCRASPAQGSGDLRPRREDRKHIHERDSQHGEIEMYNRQGKHLGAYDHLSDKQLKDPDPERTCVK